MNNIVTVLGKCFWCRMEDLHCPIIFIHNLQRIGWQWDVDDLPITPVHKDHRLRHFCSLSRLMNVVSQRRHVNIFI